MDAMEAMRVRMAAVQKTADELAAENMQLRQAALERGNGGGGGGGGGEEEDADAATLKLYLEARERVWRR